MPGVRDLVQCCTGYQERMAFYLKKKEKKKKEEKKKENKIGLREKVRPLATKYPSLLPSRPLQMALG